MPERQARAFLDEWAAENILPTFYGDRDEANALAEQCLADAELSGIASKLIVRSAGGDLEAYMLRLLNLAVDEAVQSLVGRDR
jgi:hypothetical protein